MNQCFIKNYSISYSILLKNEEGLEFSFLDSLNLYKKEGRGSSFTCILHHGRNYFVLEQSTNFESINSWVSIFYFILFQSFYSSSFLLFQLYGESVNFFYIADLHHCSFYVKSFLSHFCGVLTVQG